MIRIASYPLNGGANRYLDLYYAALAPYGFEVRAGAEIDDDFLRRRGSEFDLIHIHWGHEHIWRGRGSGLFARLRGVAGLYRYSRLAHRMGKRIVWTIHDLDPLDRSTQLDRLGAIVLGRVADLVICHTQATLDRFARRYLGDRRKLVLMPVGSYDGVFPPPRPREETLARLGLDPALRTLAAVGIVREYKGFDVAVEAVRRLGPGYQLIVAGAVHPFWPETGRDLEARAAGLPNVRLVLRQIDDSEVADIYAASDCVLLPYRWITGSGALMTAFTLSRGVVATDLPAFREVLRDLPAAGVLCRPDDPDGMAEAVTQFFSADPPARHAAARAVADRCRWPEVIKPVAERLQRLMEPLARERTSGTPTDGGGGR